MTLRQRTIAEEETPLSVNMKPPRPQAIQEKIENAKKRIDELKLLIANWEKLK